MSTKISIIVCTFNRSYAIAQCLDSIAQSISAAAPVEAEIIVVDNASTDDTSAVIKKWKETCGFPVQALYEPKKGVSAARNCALRAAKGELLAFTDDDCRLSENYVLDALRHDGADTQLVLRGGRVELGDPTDLPITIQTYNKTRYWHRPENAKKYVHLGGGMVVGCNMTMRHALAKSIGLFDENLGPGTDIPAGEDTDYIYRAYLADVKIEYVPDMTIFHYHGRKKTTEAEILLRNYVLGAGALYAKYLFKHPNLRGKFYKGSGTKKVVAGTVSPRIDISRSTKLVYAGLGAIKYWLTFGRNAASW
jgi:glycosyltransferase involved in cell wall biosynthesis